MLEKKARELKTSVTQTLDFTSKFCGVDIFLLGPKLTSVSDGLNGDGELRRDQRWRLAIYGDMLSSEHAKTRVLIHIDLLVGTLQTADCGLPNPLIPHHIFPMVLFVRVVGAVGVL